MKNVLFKILGGLRQRATRSGFWNFYGGHEFFVLNFTNLKLWLKFGRGGYV